LPWAKDLKRSARTSSMFENFPAEKSLQLGKNRQRVAIRCTLNLSPRGHVTLFFALQYGQSATRSTSFANPVEPTTRIPRWHDVHRKTFCTRPPRRNRFFEGPGLRNSSSVRGRFRRGVHPVLGHFVRAARQRLNLHTVKMVQGQAPLAHGISLLDRFHHVGLGQRRRFQQ
jgi:hypothetical protein